MKHAARMAGLRDVASISEAKIEPIPTPAPISPMAERPAPMYFAACMVIKLFILSIASRRAETV